MAKIVLALYLQGASLVGLTGSSGYEGQPGNQGNGFKGYEGQPGNQGNGQNRYEGQPREVRAGGSRHPPRRTRAPHRGRCGAPCVQSMTGAWTTRGSRSARR